MNVLVANSARAGKRLASIFAIALCLVVCVPAHGAKKDKKKADDATAQATGPRKFPFDPKKLVWPSPPNIARVRWLDYFAGMKIDYTPAEAAKPKASWMDRLAGSQPEDAKVNVKTYPFQMVAPFGIAFDSKGLVYVADQRVGAVFIFNVETRETQLIRNGYEAHFVWINGLAIDDDDRLFVSDGKLHRVLIFNPKHELEGQITEGLEDPVGLAIDAENRFLYVVDTQQDQVIVYDADTLKLLRRIGTGGKNHFLTTPGDFGAPQCVALDKDGNVYPHRSFFGFCEAALKRYKKEEKIMIVSGHNPFGAYLSSGPMQLLSKFPFIWGWASWRRAWKNYRPEIGKWGQI